MTDHTDELAGLPEAVAAAVIALDETTATVFTNSGLNWYATIRAELVRLADECAELRSAGGRGELSILKDLADARETIKRLNRRVQVAEAGVAEKVKESSGRSLGRSLANAAANIFRHERDEALAELAAMKRGIIGTTTAEVFEGISGAGMINSTGGLPRDWIGQRVALLPVGGE